MLEPYTEIWRFFLKFDQIMANQNLENHLIFAFKKIPLELFGYRKSAKKESGWGGGGWWGRGF